MKRTCLFLLGLVCSLAAKAQTPGGVTSNIQLWIKADQGVYADRNTYSAGATAATDGASVLSWQDLSGARTNDFTYNDLLNQVTGATINAPTFGDNPDDYINYNPSVVFDGSSTAMNLADDPIYSAAANGGMTMFFALAPNASTGSARFVYDFGLNATYGYGVSYSSTNLFGYVAPSADGSYTSLTHDRGTNPALVLLDIDFSDEGLFYLDNELIGTGSMPAQLTSSEVYYAETSTKNKGPVTLGAQSKDYLRTDRFFDGRMGEVLIFAYDLSADEVQRVNSYFAIKYGLSLQDAQNYLDSDGTTIWDGGTSYQYQIIGIGRDDGSALAQTQSHTPDDETRLYLGTLATSNAANTSSFAANQSFLIMGHNGGVMYTTTASNANTPSDDDVNTRLDRVWRMTNTNFTGTFGIDLTVSTEQSLSTIDAAKIYLLVDTDDDFSDATKYDTSDGLSIVNNGGVVSITGLSNTQLPMNGVRYITLGFQANNAPTFTNAGDQIIAEDAGAQSVTWATDMSAGPSYESSQTLTFTTTNNNNDLFSVQPAISAAGVLTYTPAENANGEATVQVVLKDNGGTLYGGVDETEVDFKITVNPVNDAPVAVANAITVAEGGTATTLATTETSVLANDTDEENDALSATLVDDVSNGTLTLHNDGTFSYTHDGSETTSDAFTYKAYDGSDYGNTVTVTITITPVNDAPVAVADAIEVAEGGTVTELTTTKSSVLANDTDAEGNTLTATLVTDVSNGTLTFKSDGTFSYTHDGSETTSDAFTYQVNDGTVDGNTVTVTITINPVNDAPVAVADAIEVSEGGTATALTTAETSVLANDTDAEGGTLTATLVADVAHGTLTLNSEGTFSYTHDGSETTSDSFTYKAYDGSDYGNTVTVTITITPVNDAPVAVEDAIEVAEGGTVTTLTTTKTSVLANDTDAEGNTLTATLVTDVSNGTLTFKSDGTFSYTHDGSETTSDVFTYQVNDGTVDGNTVTVTITITPVNDAPVAVADVIEVLEGGTATVLTTTKTSVLTNDTDVDGDALTAVLVTDVSHGTLTLNANGTFTYTHDGSETTSDAFTYKVNDGIVDGNTVTVTITITPVNDAPVAIADAITVAEGGTATALATTETSVLANDTDAEGNTLTATLVTDVLHGTLTFNNDGTFSYTHDGTETISDAFTYQVNDGTVDGNTVTVTITITPVNDTPVAIADAIQVLEGGTATALITTETSVLVNDTDADGDALTAVLVSDVSHGTLALNADGTFTYTHDGTETTSDAFTYKVNDGIVDGNTVTVAITIVGENDAPVAIADAMTVAEGGTVTVLNTAETSVLSNDTDADGDALTAVLVSDVSNGILTLNTDGTFTYTHDGAESTSDAFTYKANDGIVDGNTVTVTITITPVNDAPVAITDAITVAEGGTATVLTTHETSVLTNDTDAEGDALTATLVTNVTNGTLTLNADGTFTYTHDGTESTSDAFTYKVNDGTADGNTVMVTITITPVNDAPVAIADAITVTEGGTATTLTTNEASILANDTDAEGDALTASLVTSVTHGTLTLNADGTFTYTHDGAETTADSFTYIVNDGTVDGNTVTVTITITPVNDAPVAIADAITVAEGGTATTLTTNETSVLANDTDAEGDALTATLVTDVTNGTLSLSVDGTFTYTHDGSETTSDAFTYQANDGTADGNTVMVTITITPVNDAPVAIADAITVAEGGTATTLTTNETSVLTNDTDAEGDALTATLVTNVTNGTLTLSVDGTFTYTHDGSETTSDAFTYQVNDGTADGNIVTVSITITPVNDAPVAIADAINVAEGGTAITLTTNESSVLTNDIDAEGDVLTATLVTDVTNGTLMLNADGTFSYTHDGAETTADAFTYTVNDGTVDGNTVTVTIAITPVNDAPVAAADAITVSEGGTATTLTTHETSVLANDTDAEGDALTAVLVTDVTHGTLTLETDGTFTYTHDGSETIADTFTYQANDGTTGSNTVAVTITITPVNDAPVAVADNATTAQDSEVMIDVLTNDTDADDGLDATSVVITVAPTQGTVTVGTDGVVTYIPSGDYEGEDTFSYTVQDASSATSNEAVVTVVVTSAKEPPVAVDDEYETSTMTSMTLAVLSNDYDPDGDAVDLEIISVSTPAYGTVTIDGDQLSYLPTGQATSNDVFEYTIQDADGLTATATVTIHYELLPVQVSEGFSPNSDGVNDTWYIQSIENYPENHIKVFDRWGLVVCQFSQYTNANGWNGHGNTGQQAGKILQSGTYYYMINLGQGKTLNGYVTLVR